MRENDLDFYGCSQYVPGFSLTLVLPRFFFRFSSPQVTDETIRHTILRHFTTKDYITPFIIAQLESVSITLAEEYLSIVEFHGDICRDESSEGLRFYPNRFLTSP